MSNNLSNNNNGISPRILIIVIIVLVAFAGVYFMSTNSPKTPPTSTLPTGTSNPPPSGTSITTAKTLQFSVELTKSEVKNGTYTYYAKNVDEISNSYKWGRVAAFMMRIEYVSTDNVKTMTVFDASQQKAWEYHNGQWRDISSGFAVPFSVLNTQWLGYWNNLKGWSGAGDLTYVVNGVTVRVYDIKVNPLLSGSMFGPN